MNDKFPQMRPLLHDEQAAKLLGISPAWLQRKRWEGGGPVYIKYRGAVRYEPGAIEKWIADHRVTPSEGDGDE